MSDQIAVYFREYTSHGHDLVSSNAQYFYDHEIRSGQIHPGTETVIKRLGNGKPVKILRENRFGNVTIAFKLWNLETVQKIANLRALADSEGRLRVFPVYGDDTTVFRVVMLPDDEVLDAVINGGYYSQGDEFSLEFPEVEHEFPVKQVLFRSTDGNNILSVLDDSIQLEITQIDSGNSMIRFNKLPNVVSLFTPDTGKEWALESVDDNPVTADPSRSGDYTHHYRIIKHPTYSAEYLYKNRWLKVETVGRGSISDLSVGESVCLYNPFASHFDAETLADPIIEENASAAWRDDYVAPGGVFRHSDGDLVVLVNGYETGVGYTVGYFKGASLDSLAAGNSDTNCFQIYGVAGSWREDQIMASSTPIWLSDESCYIVFCSGYSTTTSKWKIGWVKFNEDFTYIAYSSNEVIDSSGSSAGFIGASVVQYKGKFWMAYTDRVDNSNPDSATGGWKLRWAVADEIDGTYTDQGEITTGRINNASSWRSSHIDSSLVFLWKGEPYIIAGGTSRYLKSGTRGNRVYGIFKWSESGQEWVEDTRNPMVLHPMYGTELWGSDYAWCNDHTGGYPCIYVDSFNRKMYFLFSCTNGYDAYKVGYLEWDLTSF